MEAAAALPAEEITTFRAGVGALSQQVARLDRMVMAAAAARPVRLDQPANTPGQGGVSEGAVVGTGTHQAAVLAAVVAHPVA